MKCECRVCGKKFKTFKSRVKIGRGRLCSNICKWIENGERWKNNLDWKKTKNTQFQKGHGYLGNYGGVSRGSKAWKDWRKNIFERDNFCCVNCGSNKQIVPHHKKDYKKYPELKFVVSNGMTLCRRCHYFIHFFK